MFEMTENALIAAAALMMQQQRAERILKKLRENAPIDKPGRPEDMLTTREMRDFHQTQAVLEKQGLKVLGDGACYVEQKPITHPSFLN